MTWQTLKARETARKKIEKNLLNDTCNLLPAGSISYSPEGVGTQAASSPRIFRGSTTIPCRFEESQTMRTEYLKNQAIVVEEWNAELPLGCGVQPDDIFVALSTGIRGRIRKIKELSVYDATITIRIEFIE